MRAERERGRRRGGGGALTGGAADAAVGLRGPGAAAVTAVVHCHLQPVFEAYRFDGEALARCSFGAAPRLHVHVKGHLQRGAKGQTLGRCHGFNLSPSALSLI